MEFFGTPLEPLRLSGSSFASTQAFASGPNAGDHVVPDTVPLPVELLHLQPNVPAFTSWVIVADD